MALSLVDYPNPHDPAHPIASAYAWLASLTLDLRGRGGRVGFSVHPNEAAWEAQPLGQVSVQLGQGGFPSLDDLMGDPDFAAAYAVIGTKLYQHAMATVPAFAGSTAS